MNLDELLTAFNEQVRRNPPPAPDTAIEHDDQVVRLTSAGWNGVIWSDLSLANADAVIAAQIRCFADTDQPWEWKYYSYDEPPDLPERLQMAGLTSDPIESLLVAEIADLSLDVPAPAGVELRPVVDQQGVEALVQLHDEVFGGDHAALGRMVLTGLAQDPPTMQAVVAIAAGAPIAGGRVELLPGTEFAGLCGGGTLPAWRGRGVFRSIVAYRAALASARGFRYLQVDATPGSRPILHHLGFDELATTTPYRHPGGSV